MAAQRAVEPAYSVHRWQFGRAGAEFVSYHEDWVVANSAFVKAKVSRKYRRVVFLRLRDGKTIKDSHDP